MAVRLYCQWPGILGDREKYLNGPLKMALSYDNAFLQIPLERHAHSANGGMRLPDYSA